MPTRSLYLCGVVVLVLIMSASALALIHQSHSMSHTRDQLDRRTTIANALTSLENELTKSQVALLNYKLTKDKTHLVIEQSFAQNATDELQRLESLSDALSPQDVWTQLYHETHLYFQGIDHWVRGPQTNSSINPVILQLGHIASLCQTLNHQNSLAMEKERKDFLATDLASRQLLMLTAGLIALISLIVIRYAWAQLHPIRTIMMAVRRIEQGDLDFQLPIDRGDEMGELLQSFNRMTRATNYRRQRLLQESITDGLTGLYNQRHFRFLLHQEIERARHGENGGGLSLLMIDIDHFKQRNDRLGHEFGNEVIKRVCKRVKEQLRSTDILARYGGDELVAILPTTTSQEARLLAERIGSAMKAIVVDAGQGRVESGITISIGGASFSAGQSAEDFIRLADAALYEAKRSGRACVRWSDSSIPLSIHSP